MFDAHVGRTSTTCCCLYAIYVCIVNMHIVVNRFAIFSCIRAGLRGPEPQRPSHQTVHSLFLASDRRLQDYDIVVAHC